MNRRIACCLAAALLVAATAGADLAPWTTHSTIKVRPFDEVIDLGDPHIYAARNEWEAFHVVVRDDAGGAMTGCTVEVSDLTGSGGTIEGVYLYRETYVDIEYPSRKPADPETAGWWPDGMVPFVDTQVGETRAGQPFDVEAGWNQPIFVDVFVPEDQTAGDYTATVTVACEGETPVSIPVTLTVWDFALPTAITLPSNYGYSCGTAYSKHQAMGGTTGQYELTQMYYREALDHRMMLSSGHCVSPVWTWDEGEQTGSFDLTAFDEQVGPVFDGTLSKPGLKFDTYRMPYPPGGASYEERIAFWRTLAEEFKERGWFDKMYLYLPDEPTPDEYPYLVTLAAQLHEADPDYRAMATEQIESQLVGSVDIWCPDEPLFSDCLPSPPYPEDYTDRQGLGEEVWWYNCTSAQVIHDFSNHFVDGQGMYMRIWQWLTRRYNFDGLLFWHSVWLYSSDSDDPWTDQYADRFLCNGDGTMFYPGAPSKIGGETDIPVPSLRLKLFREGMEDYEYMHILDEMGYSDWVQSEVEARAWRSFIWEHDALVVEQSRRRMAALILGELDTEAPAAPAGIAAASETESVRLTWNAVADTDVARYEISLARYTGERIPSATVDETTTEYLFEDLEAGKPYYLTVRAIDETGNVGEWGDEVSAAPLAPSSDDDDDDSDDDSGDDSDDDDDDGCSC